MGSLGFIFNFDPASLFQRRDRVTLPQHDPPPARRTRAASLSAARAAYVWDNRQAISGAVLIDDLPRSERPSLSWIEALFPVLLRVNINSRINADEAAVHPHPTSDDVVVSVRDHLWSIIGRLLALVTNGTFGPNDAIHAAETEMNASKKKRKTSALKLKGGGTIQQHKELFENIALDTVAKDNQFLSDDMFAWYRVAGPNPMRLTRCGVTTKSATTGDVIKKEDTTVEALFPELTDAILRGVRGFDNDSIKEIVQQKRAYFVNYPEFDGVQTGLDFETKQVKKNFLYAPTCLLVVPKGGATKPDDSSSTTTTCTAATDKDKTVTTSSISNNHNRVGLLPVAIRCGQRHTTNTKDNNTSLLPMFTANASHTDELTWQAAKITVQVADAVIHEVVYHLGRTHLMMEIFICATHRALADSHPVYRLLKAHFYGTAFINALAAKILINPGGVIDTITAPDVIQTQQVSAAGVSGPGTIFNEMFIDVDLKARDVMDEDTLHFPYRDDALKVWNAIQTWVGAYIGAYYKSDADVISDTELQDWVHELTDIDKGGLRGLGDPSLVDHGDGDNRIVTVEYLTKVIAHAVFTASAQHAAVNFPQSTMMQFVPAMPLAGHSPAPGGRSAKYETMDELSRKMLPTLENAEMQLSTLETIGTVQFGVLGEYGRSLDFAPDEVRDAMERFQMELGVIDGIVQARNKEEKKVGLPIYKHLSPKNIPNSINV